MNEEEEPEFESGDEEVPESDRAGVEFENDDIRDAGVDDNEVSTRITQAKAQAIARLRRLHTDLSTNHLFPTFRCDHAVV